MRTTKANIGLRSLFLAISASCALGGWGSARAAEIRFVVKAGRSIIALTGPIEVGEYNQFLSAHDGRTSDPAIIASPGGDPPEGLAIAAALSPYGSARTDELGPIQQFRPRVAVGTICIERSLRVSNQPKRSRWHSPR